MASGVDRDRFAERESDPSARQIIVAFAAALAFVLATRWPVARVQAFDFDEVGYLEMIQNAAFPMHHTLFLAAGRALGGLLGQPYLGFVILDMFTSALALVAAWWWMRALVGPRTAAAAALLLGCGPVFWAYGAMAGNYTTIVFVGSTLLGIAWRGRSDPRTWYPFVAAVVLALGAGYRQDIGTFWLPIFLVILWQHRWMAAAQALLLFVALISPGSPPCCATLAAGQTIGQQAPSSPTRRATRIPSGTLASSMRRSATR
jgi:hypothetical protein